MKAKMTFKKKGTPTTGAKGIMRVKKAAPKKQGYSKYAAKAIKKMRG